METTRTKDVREDTVTEAEPGEQNYHSARRVFGLSAVMFWSIVPILVVAIVIILWMAL